MLGKLIQGINDLATINSELIKEWDYVKNGDLKPTDVTSGSGKKVWWICDKGHSFESIIANRNLHHRGCPYCAGQKVLPGFNDLFSLNPELAQKWDYVKNNTLKPTDITCGFEKKFGGFVTKDILSGYESHTGYQVITALIAVGIKYCLVSMIWQPLILNYYLNGIIKKI